jgi:hypothetical protein
MPLQDARQHGGGGLVEWGAAINAQDGVLALEAGARSAASITESRSSFASFSALANDANPLSCSSLNGRQSLSRRSPSTKISRVL